MKKIFISLVLLVSFAACSSDVNINTFRAKGGPLGDSVVRITDSSSNIEGATSPNGSLVVNLEYGTYEVEAIKEGYETSKAKVKVDLFGAISGIRIDLKLAEKKTEE